MIQISIIIPTFKPGSYLNECLKSIHSQNLDKSTYEVLIVLNGQKDPFFENLKSKTVGSNNTTVIHIPNSGVSNARNYGMTIAKGRFFVFIDDDDIISPNYLNNLLQKSNEERITISNVKTFTNNISITNFDYISKSFIKNSHRDTINIISLKSCLVTVWGKLIPKRIIGEVQFNPKFKKGEDHLFIAQISNQIKGFDLASNDTIYYRRIRNDSATRNITDIGKEWNIFTSLFLAYIRVYLSSPLKYNLLFFILREMAMTKAIIFITRTYIRNRTY